MQEPLTKGTPGLFKGQNYRPGKVEKAKLTEELIKEMVKLENLKTGGVSTKDYQQLLPGAKAEITKIENKIIELKNQGADLKEAQKEFQKTKPI